ncbi:hypothetical protein EVAR_91537_1 [Eumeta japonica]|uniref:Uncharacterized protein n=1 Tax=Eumeta variegata TaxID=151549 RepID=A0A4C1VEC4_EUMVA|nr:hypothetical protein EVAR_91537_1 [Eumeta japonica]
MPPARLPDLNSSTFLFGHRLQSELASSNIGTDQKGKSVATDINLLEQHDIHLLQKNLIHPICTRDFVRVDIELLPSSCVMCDFVVNLNLVALSIAVPVLFLISIPVTLLIYAGPTHGFDRYVVIRKKDEEYHTSATYPETKAKDIERVKATPGTLTTLIRPSRRELSEAKLSLLKLLACYLRYGGMSVFL